jgi:hypothetical protein
LVKLREKRKIDGKDRDHKCIEAERKERRSAWGSI